MGNKRGNKEEEERRKGGGALGKGEKRGNKCVMEKEEE